MLPLTCGQSCARPQCVCHTWDLGLAAGHTLPLLGWCSWRERERERGAAVLEPVWYILQVLGCSAGGKVGAHTQNKKQTLISEVECEPPFNVAAETATICAASHTPSPPVPSLARSRVFLPRLPLAGQCRRSRCGDGRRPNCWLFPKSSVFMDGPRATAVRPPTLRRAINS